MNKIGPPRLVISLVLILLFVGVGLAFFFFTASPASAFLFTPLTPTQENLWAYSYVAKPTYTVTSTILPTDTPVPQPTFTETPASLAMEIVENTSAPVYSVEQPASQPLPSYSGSKYILVDISEQHMYVY